MDTSRSLHALGAALVALLVLAGCGELLSGGSCSTDGDCAGDRVCFEQACVSPGAAQSARSAQHKARAARKKAKAAKKKAKTAKKKAKTAKKKAKTTKKKSKAEARAIPSYSRAAQCREPCLFLMNHTFKEVQNKLCTWCPNTGEYCELDWPSSDVPSCGVYRRLMNCVYAGYGYSFKKKRWRQAFGRTSWYRPRPRYQASWHTKVADRNIQRMKRIAEGAIPGCQG